MARPLCESCGIRLTHGATGICRNCYTKRNASYEVGLNWMLALQVAARIAADSRDASEAAARITAMSNDFASKIGHPGIVTNPQSEDASHAVDQPNG